MTYCKQGSAKANVCLRKIILAVQYLTFVGNLVYDSSVLHAHTYMKMLIK